MLAISPLKQLKSCLLLISLFLILLTAQTFAHEIKFSGATYEAVTLSIEGPALDEKSEINPFADIRFDWIVTKGEDEWVVPGYFAACGNAADTSCTQGKTWRAHFIPSERGAYNWKIRFRKGTNIAILNPLGTPLE